MKWAQRSFHHYSFPQSVRNANCDISGRLIKLANPSTKTDTRLWQILAGPQLSGMPASPFGSPSRLENAPAKPWLRCVRCVQQLRYFHFSAPLSFFSRPLQGHDNFQFPWPPPRSQFQFSKAHAAPKGPATPTSLRQAGDGRSILIQSKHLSA